MAITIKPDTPNTISTTVDNKSVSITKDQKSITISNDTTSVVSVTAQGPQGQKGDTGDTGAQGPQGISAFSGSAESSSISTRLSTAESELGNTLISSSAQISSDISGSFTSLSGSLSTRLTTDETNITNLQTDSGSFSTRITTAESELGNTLISSSAQISSDISGSFTAPSASFSTRITTAESELGNTIISSSAQIASDISGSSNDLSSSLSTRLTTDETNITNLQTDSGSFSSRITTEETNVDNLQTDSGSFSTRITTAETELSNTLVSSSAQIASDIRGSFTSGFEFTGTISGSSTSTGSFGHLIGGQTATINGFTFPTTDGTDGQALITDGSGVLTFDDIKSVATVKNISGVTLQKGTPVHATGSVGNTPTVIAASASDATTMPATFVLDEQLVDDAEGRALLSGFINGVNTAGFVEGGIVYVGENGGYTQTKPTGINLIQNLGIVTKIDSSNGSGYIYGSGRSNDVPNLLDNTIFYGSGSNQMQQIHISGALQDTNLGYAIFNDRVEASSFTGSLLSTNGVLSSSAQIASDISGSFTAPSASISTRLTTAETELSNTLISSSAQIASDISGSFNQPSASISTRLTTAETELSNTLISSSAQIASDISGSFTGGTGVTITSGEITIGQDVGTTANVDFGSVTTTGNVNVGGNLDVSGTTTSIDSATLNIGDKNITIGSGSTTSAQLDGGGIDFGLGGTIANLHYRHSDTSITSSVDFRAPNFYGIFSGALSSSAQISSDISGSFTAASSSFSTRITTAETELDNTLISSSAQIASDISGSFTAPSSSFSTRVTTLETDLSTEQTNIDNLQTDSGSFSTRITAEETNVNNLQTDSGSFSTRVTTNETDISNVQTDSGSFSTRITTAETELSNTLVSSSAQIASDISGSFTAGTGLDLSSGEFSVDVSDFMSNGVDNRVLTATGTDAFNAEANLTFDGNVLEVTHISASGNISGSEGRFSGDVIAFYSSDKRLKDNIIKISNPIEKIKSIGGYEFDWNDNQSTYEGHDIGVIAQEIEYVMPELVTTRDTGYKAVKYEKIIALLIEGIKEQQKQIDEIKNKL